MESKVISLQLLSLSWFGFTARKKEMNWIKTFLFLVLSFIHKEQKWNIHNKSTNVVLQKSQIVGKEYKYVFYCGNVPVKQPVGEERTKKWCAHARCSQPARIYSIVVSKPGDSLIWSFFLLDYCPFLTRTNKPKKHQTHGLGAREAPWWKEGWFLTSVAGALKTHSVLREMLQFCFQ